MSYAAYLRQLLRPLGVYTLSGTANGAELDGIGAGLDAVEARLEHIQREMNLGTAENDGLESLERLLTRRPVTQSAADRRAALAALLRIGGDSFTPAAVNDNLRGCGVEAVAQEHRGAQAVRIWFPGVPGMPDGFAEMKKIIEDIVPCHLAVEYLFWYMTWARLEARFRSWSELEREGYLWQELEKLVE